MAQLPLGSNKANAAWETSANLAEEAAPDEVPSHFLMILGGLMLTPPDSFIFEAGAAVGTGGVVDAKVAAVVVAVPSEEAALAAADADGVAEGGAGGVRPPAAEETFEATTRSLYQWEIGIGRCVLCVVFLGCGGGYGLGWGVVFAFL